MNCWYCDAPVTDTHEVRNFDGVLRVVPAGFETGEPYQGATKHTCSVNPPSNDELYDASLAALQRIYDISAEPVGQELIAAPSRERALAKPTSSKVVSTVITGVLGGVAMVALVATILIVFLMAL